jgi:hypothetical protein
LIFVSLNKEDSLLAAAEQDVRCPFALLVDDDQLIVFRGEKDVGLLSFWVLDHGQVNHLLTHHELIRELLPVGEIKYNQSVSVRNYEERIEIQVSLENLKVMVDSTVQHVLKFGFNWIF